MGATDAQDPDWLAVCSRIAAGIRDALAGYPTGVGRTHRLGRGAGGDTTLAIDGAAEDVAFAELERLGVGLVAISEERGEVLVCGGGPLRVVIDPIDGSLNAKRGLPAYSVSIAVADGDSIADVLFGYVCDLTSGEQWWAFRERGAYCDGDRLDTAIGPARLEILAIESAAPRLIAEAAEALSATGADRLRMIGSIALSLCFVASARVDALVSLRGARSVDAAAGALIVREAGGAVAFPDDPAAPLSLGMRSRVFAASGDEILAELLALPLGPDGAARG